MLKIENKKLIWTDEMKNIVLKIKEDIKEKSTLIFPNYQKKFIIQCDASDLGIGAVLMQDEGIISHYSRKFKNSEKNYSIVEKELFAILKSLFNFREIIQGYFVDVYTDNKNCTFLKTSSSRAEKWRILMNDFNFRINFIEGKQNVIADELSRCFINYNDMKDENKLFHNNVKNFLISDNNGTFLKTKDGKFLISNNKKVEFLEFIHKTSRHSGISIMYENIRKYFYLKNIIKEIKMITNNCKDCCENKNSMFFKRNFSEIDCKIPFERVSTDIYGPFEIHDFEHDKSKSKAFYITFTDIHSRLTRIHLLENITGEIIKRSFQTWISEFGRPKFLISDNGRQYTGKIFSKFLNSNDIKHLKIPPYSPISNGISERINKTITEGLRFNRYKKLETIKEWIEFKINNNFNRNLGASPNCIIYGYDFYDPHYTKKTFNKKITKNQNFKITKKLNVGDYVYLKNFMCKKLEKQYHGPYKIQLLGKKLKWVKLEGCNSWFHIRALKF
ncbi:Transposon Tf2-6 polyprotein [Dictyocoela muelleri]|nr:Transposon Tf2-6 polyprotein [Dictyocoela muelleri]